DFQEMALPDSAPNMLNYVRSRAARAVREAMLNRQGPVHVNFPFREPLMPDLNLPNLWGEGKTVSYNMTYVGEKRLPDESLMLLAEKLISKKKGVIVCGPQFDPSLAPALSQLSEKLQIPILAD